MNELQREVLKMNEFVGLIDTTSFTKKAQLIATKNVISAKSEGCYHK